MRDYLILKLQGVMQAWGEHTFEGLRPSGNFPTRSALLGLLGACLGIDRTDRAQQEALSNSFHYAARQDVRKHLTVKFTDYHTINEAREDYIGLKSLKHPIETRREYLLDATFTVAIWNMDKTTFSLDRLQKAVCRPHYTPFLGRRSCPITRPLYEGRIEAINSDEAFKKVPPSKGVIYSEDDIEVSSDRNKHWHRVRDVPLPNQPRQFASRIVYVYGEEGSCVSE